MDRRKFLQMLGLFSSTTILSSCGSESEQKKLISYLVPPEDGVLPGEALWHPSTCTECPAHCGLLVRVRDGRPVKLEGNPGHPVSGGGLCVRGQASLWRLYHPQRIKGPLRRDAAGQFRQIGWEEAYALIHEALARAREEGRQSVYLAGRTTGSLGGLIDLACTRMGMERLPEFEFFAHAALRKAHGILFGRDEVPHYRLAKADFLLTLGADLFETFVSPVDYAAQFSRAAQRPDFAWFHLEPHLSLTGANAHERLAIHPGSEPFLLAFLLQGLAGHFRSRLPEEVRKELPDLAAAEVARRTGLSSQRLEEILERLKQAQSPLLIAGGVATGHDQGLTNALLAGLIQWTLGMLGKTVDFACGENYAGVGSLHDMRRLAGRLAKGEVGVIFLSRTNPVYHLPASFAFAEGLKKAHLRVGLADFLDETAGELDLLLPLSHALESWGDAEPRTGVRTLIQPVVKPLHGTRTEGDILLDLWGRETGETPFVGYREFLFSQWRHRHEQEALQKFSARGYLVEPVRSRPVTLNADPIAAFLKGLTVRPALEKPVLVVAPSIRTFDGRSRHLPLLAEVPDPLTTVSYGRWVSVSPAAAAKMKLRDRDEVRLAASGWTAVMPVKIQPGLPEGVFTVQRDALEEAPFTVDQRSGEALLYLPDLHVERTGRRLPLSILAGSTSQQGRGIIPDPVSRKEQEHRRFSLYPEHEHPDYRWAMAIDLKLCIGCGACAAACYIENNVPVTGEKDHLKGREMSWLRLEPFYDEQGRAEFVPMLCQHCHNAPCEPVCPVYAAYHNPEGLNVQVYNRCVGTRYCANNCPYKVRRFNWWEHQQEKPLEGMRNPDLSVRSRGMMEKCTFCIQRIRTARDKARDEGRRIRDGEVTTACAQSCPTGAIVFGSLLDEESRVSRLVQSERVYRIFEELGTEPSVYYLRAKGEEA